MGWRGQCSPRRSGLWPGELVALSLEQPVDPQAALAQVLPCNPSRTLPQPPLHPSSRSSTDPLCLPWLAFPSHSSLASFLVLEYRCCVLKQTNKQTKSDEITVCSSPKEVSDLLMTICLSTLCKKMKQSGVGGQCQGRQK